MTGLVAVVDDWLIEVGSKVVVAEEVVGLRRRPRKTRRTGGLGLGRM